RLAVLPGLGDGDLLEVLLHAIGDAVQDQCTLRNGGATPCRCRLVGGIQGGLNIGGGGTGDLTEDLTGHRGDVLHVLALHRWYPLPTDVVVIPLLVVDDRAFGPRVG